MKKLWYLLLLPVAGLAAYLVWQNLPQKRHARHMVKARLYAKENNLTAARLEYEKAYNAIGTFTPHASLEVVQLLNRQALQEKQFDQALENTRAFVRAHPRNRDGHLLLSELAFQAGDLKTAFASVQTALALDPEHFPARMLLMRARAAQGRLDLAEEQLRFLARKYPDSVGALLPLAQNMLQQGRIEESRTMVRTVLEKRPDDAPAMLLLVDGYLMERKPDSAEALLESWQAKADEPLVPTLAIRRANLKAMKEDMAGARALLSPYAKPREENAAPLGTLAFLYAMEGKYDSALQIYSSLGENVPSMRGPAISQGIFLHLKSLNPAKALEQAKLLAIGNKSREIVPILLACYVAMSQDNKARELIAQQPDSLRAGLTQAMQQWEPTKEFMGQWALVEYCRMNGQPFWTLKATQELYRQWPRNNYAASLFAAQLASLRQHAAAAQILEGAKEKTPQMKLALLALYVQSGQGGKAKALAQGLLKEDPKQPGLNRLLADYAWAAGDKQGGIELYQRELAINPDDLVSINNLAWEFGIVQGDLQKAEPYLKRLIALKSMDARILDTIGWILAKNKKLSEGEGYIREALLLVPDHPSYLYHLGWILGQAGDKPGAIKALRSALDSKVPFNERKAAEEYLASLA